MKQLSFDITIPVLNEEETLEKQVLILHRFLKAHYPAENLWRIVIADNGSKDKTLSIAKELSKNHPEIISITVPAKGVGLALKTSWEQSDAGIVGYMDLDLATDLLHFPQAYRAIAESGWDMVYASRLHPDARVIGRTLKREITSKAFNYILKFYLNVSFSDGMCGFKFLKREYFQKLKDGGAVSDGWFFSTELLTVAEWLGLRIYELPVQWTDDTSSSRVKIIPLAKQYLRAMKVLKRNKPKTIGAVAPGDKFST